MIAGAYPFRMTAHAVRRFGQRVLDLDDTRAASLTEDAVAAMVPPVVQSAVSMGCTKVVADGVTYIATSGRVVTVLGAGMWVSRRRGGLS